MDRLLVNKRYRSTLYDLQKAYRAHALLIGAEKTAKNEGYTNSILAGNNVTNATKDGDIAAQRLTIDAIKKQGEIRCLESEVAYLQIVIKYGLDLETEE